MTKDLSGCLLFCVKDVEILKRLKIHVSVSSALFLPCSLAIGVERLHLVAIPIISPTFTWMKQPSHCRQRPPNTAFALVLGAS